MTGSFATSVGRPTTLLLLALTIAAVVPACTPADEGPPRAGNEGGSPLEHVTRLQPFIGSYDVMMISGDQEMEGMLDVRPILRGRYVEWTLDAAGDFQRRLLTAWDPEGGRYRAWRFDSRSPLPPGGNEGTARFADGELVMEWMAGREENTLRNRFRMTSEDTLVLVTELELSDGEMRPFMQVTGHRATNGDGPASGAAARHVTTEELLLQPSRKADHRVSFGPEGSNFGDLRLPDGEGPHPVAVLVHGGCWLSFATLRHFDHFAEELTARGLATWNISYRKIDESGGGWPGTFHDVAAGVDHVRALAEEHDLDEDRVFVVGHSAGGHLAAWAAGRPGIPPSSPLHTADPLPVTGVVNLAGPADLEGLVGVDEQACGRPILESLVGGSPEEVPERYAAASPARLLPLDVPQLHIVGAEDELRPLVEAFAGEAREAGDPVEFEVVPGAGHHDVIAPWSAGWDPVRDLILDFVVAGDRGER